MIDKTILHYQITEKLGEGGMGVVYKARDTKLDRLVALKFLPERFTVSDTEKARLLQEAKAAAALNHPNVCVIYEIQEQVETPFIAMEYVNGKTLREIVNTPLIPPQGGTKGGVLPSRGELKGGVLPINEAINYAIQIGEALQEAHSNDVVHRDIKSENIMVNAKNQIKVMDFGLAKLKGSLKLTQTASTIGTLAYMSPEQIQTSKVDARSDIFSFGVVLYEMLTGRLPFGGDYEAAMMYAILNEEPDPLQKHLPDASSELLHILNRALEKDPEDRYQSMADLVSELRRLKKQTSKVSRRSIPVQMPVADTQGASGQSGSGLSSSVSVQQKDMPVFKSGERFSPKRGLALAGAILAVAIIAFLAYRFLKTPAQSSRIYATFTQITSAPEVESFPDISPDGKYVIYTRQGEGQSDIFFQRVGGGNVLNLTKDSPSDDYQPVFSPDGEQIAFRSDRDGGGLFVMGATGESVRRVTDFGYNPVWSPDGTHLLFATENVLNPYGRSSVSSLWTVQVKTGETHKVPSGDAVQPVYSPHGLRIAFWTLRGQGGQRDLFTIPAGGGDPVDVTNDAPVDWNPVWSPDGNYLYFASDRGGSMNLWRIAIDEKSGEVRGKPQPITTPSGNMVHLRISGDGTKAVYASVNTRSNIFKIAFDPDKEKVTGLPVPVTRGNQVYLTPDISPTGKQIVFWNVGGQEDLFICDADGRNLRQITNDVFKDRGPWWSPDGRRIVFYSDRGGKYDFWTIRPDGSELTQLTYSPPEVSQIYTPKFFPDGKQILGLGTQGTYIFDFPPTSKEWNPQILPTLENDQKVFLATSVSPDGRWLAGQTQSRNGPNDNNIILFSLQTQEYELLSRDKAFGPVWLHDNQQIIFWNQNGLALIDRVTKQSHAILLNSATVNYNWVTPSADDRTLYFIGSETESDIWMANLEGQ